jgi:hypothetical protein
VRELIVGLMLIGLCGCKAGGKNDSSNRTENVDNATTRYVENLQGSQLKADVVMDQYNQAVRDREAAAKEASPQ